MALLGEPKFELEVFPLKSQAVGVTVSLFMPLRADVPVPTWGLINGRGKICKDEHFSGQINTLKGKFGSGYE